MTPRPAHQAFLEGCGWGSAIVRPLAGDASFRRYFRVEDRGRCAVLMDAPPEHEDVRPFIRIADLLIGAGFSAPRLLACDDVQGFLLIEDFGDGVAGPLLAQEPAREYDLYEQTVDLLAELQHLQPPADLPPYDRDVLKREVLLFPQWYARAAGLSVDEDSFLAAWDEGWAPLLEEGARDPVVVLRDFHVDNLMLLPDRTGVRRLGLLDFQDALAGHRAYDLVSLLQDARRDVSPRLEREMLSRFINASGVGDAMAFRRSYEVLGAQRNVKILGIFMRLRDRDGRTGYVERLPRVWNYVERNLMHPALAPVKSWFDQHVPTEFRSQWCR